MKGRTAGMIFLGFCIVLAALLLLHVIGPTTSGAAFAVALVVLGVASKGFKQT